MHALTGCDSTSYPYLKGKATSFNVLMKYNLPELASFGEENTTTEKDVNSWKKFFSHIYSSSFPIEMKSLRYSIFSRCKNTPEIKTLPPTDEALAQHSLRCHLQVMTWKATLNEKAPTVDISEFGWLKKDCILHPVTGVQQVAPVDLLKTVACSCKFSKRCCSTDTCSCKSSGMSCITYCRCEGGPDCHNEHTKHDDEDDGIVLLYSDHSDDDETDTSDDEEINTNYIYIFST